jgi:hypothetical protein
MKTGCVSVDHRARDPSFPDSVVDVEIVDGRRGGTAIDRGDDTASADGPLHLRAREGGYVALRERIIRNVGDDENALHDVSPGYRVRNVVRSG